MGTKLRAVDKLFMIEIDLETSELVVLGLVSKSTHSLLNDPQVQSLQELGQSEEASDVAVQATEAHPHSVSMWLLRLRTHCVAGGGGGSHDALCRDALEQVPKEV